MPCLKWRNELVSPPSPPNVKKKTCCCDYKRGSKNRLLSSGLLRIHNSLLFIVVFSLYGLTRTPPATYAQLILVPSALRQVCVCVCAHWLHCRWRMLLLRFFGRCRKVRASQGNEGNVSVWFVFVFVSSIKTVSQLRVSKGRRISLQQLVHLV